MKPAFQTVFTVRKLTVAQARALGLEPYAPQATDDQVIEVDVPPDETFAAAAERYVADTPAAATEAWFTVPLEGGWCVAYRVFPVAGRVLIGEVRVFPREDPPLPHVQPGEWRGTFLGLKASFPAGGVTARLLHHIPLGNHVYTLLPAALQAKREEIRRDVERSRGWMPQNTEEATERARQIAEQTDVIQYLEITSLGFTDTPPRPAARGPKGRPDRFFAELARAYLSRCSMKSRSPIADVAAARKMSVAAVRDAIFTARHRKLLTNVKQGGAGGTLTELAVEILGSRRPGRRPCRRP